MYIYDHKSLGARSLPKRNSYHSRLVRNAYYPDRVLRRVFGARRDCHSFSPACDRSVATPAFSAAEQSKLTGLLSPSQSAQAINGTARGTRLNLAYDSKISSSTWLVTWILAQCELLSRNPVDHTRSSEGTIDAVCVEAAHQFQAKVYFYADDQTGAVGPSTLDSLGIVKHKLKPKIGNVFGRESSTSISDKISRSNRQRIQRQRIGLT